MSPLFSHTSATSLVDEIVQPIAVTVAGKPLRPSAHAVDSRVCGSARVSRFTVVKACDRLAASAA